MNINSITNLVHEIAAHVIVRCDGDQRVAEREAWWLLEKLTGQFEAELLVDNMIILSDDQEEHLQLWIKQRVQEKKPLQYILESVPFGGIDILTAPPILIPRPETEEIVAWVIEIIKKSGVGLFDLLDLCTGTGCIALALAKTFPQATVIGSDINAQAVALAEKNKKLNMINNAQFIVSDMYEQLDPQRKFDMIISNPPYLSSESYEKVSDEIRLWEDPKALVAEDSGMALYERILERAKEYLKIPDQKNKLPQLVLEIGIDQKNIEAIVKKYGFNRVELFNDMQRMPRWIAAWL